MLVLQIIVLSTLLILCIVSIKMIDKRMDCKDIFFKYEELEKIKKCIDSCTTVKQVQDIYSWINYLVLNKQRKIWERCGLFTKNEEQLNNDWDHLKYMCFNKKKELENK